MAESNSIFEYEELGGVKFPIAGKEFSHPKPDCTQGTRLIKANTDLSHLTRKKWLTSF